MAETNAAEIPQHDLDKFRDASWNLQVPEINKVLEGYGDSLLPHIVFKGRLTKDKDLQVSIELKVDETYTRNQLKKLLDTAKKNTKTREKTEAAVDPNVIQS